MAADRTDTPQPTAGCLAGKNVLITGGTGSLGRVLLNRILTGEQGMPARITVFSRDEAKQHDLRLAYQQRRAPTDDIIYDGFRSRVRFRIGDVRDFHAVAAALADSHIVFNAAALKQVPTCEYFPAEAVATNVGGAQNIVRAIRELQLGVEMVIGISTDKAVKPVNVMGMTKAVQERVFSCANLECRETRFTIVRYGNVLASRGSVIPLFLEQVQSGGPLTVTDPAMTRFLLSLDEAVDVVFAACIEGGRGETFVPRIPGARILDIAAAYAEQRGLEIRLTGIRPGEKLNEVLISEEEAQRVEIRGNYYVIRPILPELSGDKSPAPILKGEYSSADELLSVAEVANLLRRHRLMAAADVGKAEGDVLR